MNENKYKYEQGMFWLVLIFFKILQTGRMQVFLVFILFFMYLFIFCGDSYFRKDLNSWEK